MLYKNQVFRKTASTMMAGLKTVIGSWSMFNMIREIMKNGLVLSVTGNFSGFALQFAALGFLYQSVKTKITIEYKVIANRSGILKICPKKPQ